MSHDSRWLRLPVLLACLLAATIVLLHERGVLWGSTPSAQAGVVQGCDGRRAAQAAPLAAGELARLREQALAPLPPADGAYEQGLVGSENLWSDDRPAPATHATAGTPAGYEARWWALDAEGRRDDVVVDVLRYADARAARQALALAADARCRRDGSARAATLPAGARLLSWVNPDGAYQQDTLLARGSFLYRVADAPPTVESDAAQWARERARVTSATQALACALPRAACPAAALAKAAARAGAPAPAPDVPATWPATAAQAAAYVRAVSLRAYDVPYMTAVESGAAVHEAIQPAFAAACLAGAPPLAPARSASSPQFAFDRRGQVQGVWSIASLLGSEAASEALLAADSRAFANGCAKRYFSRALAREQRAEPRVRFVDVRVQALPVAAPERYADVWPRRAVAERISYVALLSTRRGRRERVRYFEEGFAFAYRRAVVQLAIVSAPSPLADANRSYLESVLVGRAVAAWGRPAR